jgi:hypothetical protein
MPNSWTDQVCKGDPGENIRREGEGEERGDKENVGHRLAS